MPEICKLIMQLYLCETAIAQFRESDGSHIARRILSAWWYANDSYLSLTNGQSL